MSAMAIFLRNHQEASVEESNLGEVSFLVGGLFFFLCGLSLERLLLNDPLDQSLHFAILAVLGEFPLLCHAHSLPQTQQSDHLRPPVCTVANTKRFLLSAKGGSRLNGAAWCIPVCRAHDKKRPVDPDLSHETLFGQTTPKAACHYCRSSGALGGLSFSL
jgi:hypothetical protein